MDCDSSAVPSAEAAELRRRLYAMKNGVVADALRAGGCPYRMIWGLNLPQLVEIADSAPHSVQLAEEMWADSVLREAHLMGPLLYPSGELGKEAAMRLIEGVRWPEDADILCFKLLRKAPFAADIAGELAQSDEPLKRYTALRLYFNIVSRYPREAREAARKELQRPNPISTLARMLIEEASFILGEE